MKKIGSFILILFVMLSFSSEANARGHALRGFIAHRLMHKARKVIVGGAVAYGVTNSLHSNSTNGDGKSKFSADMILSDVALYKSTAELRKNLKKDKGLEKPKDCAAHHIVPQSEKRDWAERDANDARSILASCKIGIDSAINGVYLPSGDNPECTGANHYKLHTKLYYKTVASLLVAARNGGCSKVIDKLTDIGKALQENSFIGGVH